MTKKQQDAESTNVHIYFVLDRTGSMESIASDVVGGFNSFLTAQQADGPDALMTLIQFDTQDPHEVIAEAAPIAEMDRLTAQTFVPRAATPLYDAMGHAIADATIRAESRRRDGLPPEEILFVTFTDGLENASVEYDRSKLFDLVKKREEQGWTFAYLGANQDSYAEAGDVGYSAASIQNFRGDGTGARAAYDSLSRSVSKRRDKIRMGQSYDPADLFEGDKGAEDDLRSRKP